MRPRYAGPDVPPQPKTDSTRPERDTCRQGRPTGQGTTKRATEERTTRETGEAKDDEGSRRATAGGSWDSECEETETEGHEKRAQTTGQATSPP